MGFGARPFVMGVAVLTLHSGDARRVNKACQAARRTRLYTALAPELMRSTKTETFANRRAISAKLRWAVRATGPQ